MLAFVFIVKKMDTSLGFDALLISCLTGSQFYCILLNRIVYKLLFLIKEPYRHLDAHSQVCKIIFIEPSDWLAHRITAKFTGSVAHWLNSEVLKWSNGEYNLPVATLVQGYWARGRQCINFISVCPLLIPDVLNTSCHLVPPLDRSVARILCFSFDYDSNVLHYGMLSECHYA